MKRIFRKTGAALLLSLLAIFALLLPAEPFETYDVVQQSISANIASKTYEGDAIIVQIDRDDAARVDLTEAEILPELLTLISSANAKQIVIDYRPPETRTAADTALFTDALAKLPEKPVFLAYVSEVARPTLAESYTLSEPKRLFSIQPFKASVADKIIVAHQYFDFSNTGAPIDISPTLETDQGLIPSGAQLLADYAADLPPGLPINQRYNPRTIPRISSAALLTSEQVSDALTDKRVVISQIGRPFVDNVRTARGNATERAVLPILGAQTLLDGPPAFWGPLPAFLLGALGAIAWTYLRRPYGRWLGLGTLSFLIISPFVLETYLIYQHTSHGIVLLLALGVGRLVLRYNTALAEAHQAAQSKSWFLAQASHDLRQPIHAVGMLSARLGQTEMSPFQKDLVRKIDRSVDGASRMFKSLLDIASLESGSLQPVIAPVSINEILAEIEEVQGIAAERANVELRLAPSELIVMTDRALATTMLQNLVSNAIKYATGKKVLVGARRRGTTVSLCVYDRGGGISTSDIRKVSKEFFRASKRAQIEGSGLGLAIVERLCALLDLQFRIKSKTGHGTGAIIEGIPITQDTRRSVSQSPQMGSPLLQGLRVYIVDDDIDTLRATEALVRQWGCEPTSKDTFPDELDCDVIISDFDFGNGITLADHTETIRDLRSKGVNTIVVSGHAVGFVKDVLDGAAQQVLGKPLRPAELRSVLMADRMAARD